MKTRTMLALAAGLAVAWGPTAPADEKDDDSRLGRIFEKLDRNDDGKVTLEEAPEKVRPRLKRILERLDKEALTKEDAKKIRERFRQRRRDPEARAEALFKRLDTDGDGKTSVEEAPKRGQRILKRVLQKAEKEEDATIGQEEFTKILVEHARKRHGERGHHERGHHGRRHGPAFLRKWDEDGNHRLSKKELQQAVEKFDELDRNDDGQLDLRELMGAGRPPRGRRGHPPVERIFEKLDQNGDKKIDEDEARGPLKKHFSQLDENEDGVLEPEELKKGFSKRHKERGKDGRRPKKDKEK